MNVSVAQQHHHQMEMMGSWTIVINAQLRVSALTRHLMCGRNQDSNLKVILLMDYPFSSSGPFDVVIIPGHV